MCKIMEELIEKEKKDMAMDFTKNLLTMGYIPIDKIAEAVGLPLETVEALAQEIPVNTVKS